MSADFHRTSVDNRSFIRGAARLLIAPADIARPTKIADVIALASSSGPPAVGLYDAASGWTDLGATKTGIQVTINNAEETFDVDQVYGDISSAPTSWECSVGTQLAEMTPEKMQVAWEGSAITIDAGPTIPSRSSASASRRATRSVAWRSCSSARTARSARTCSTRSSGCRRSPRSRTPRPASRSRSRPLALPRGHDADRSVQALLHHPRPVHARQPVGAREALHFCHSRGTQGGLVHWDEAQKSIHMGRNRLNINMGASEIFSGASVRSEIC
jgi:hypothetical protein